MVGGGLGGRSRRCPGDPALDEKCTYVFGSEQLTKTSITFLAAAAVGLIAFSPLMYQTPARDPLGFLAILPLLWAALRRGPRNTATVALILASFAIWGTMAGRPLCAVKLE